MTFGPLISVDELRARAGEVRAGGLHVVDVRSPTGGRAPEVAYRAGHLPGAVRVDLDTELAGAASTADGRHPLPSPDAFAAALGRAGIAGGTRVVAYDDAGGSVAARLWWMLHVLGEPVAVLDGGLAAWQGELETGTTDPRPVRRAAQPWPVDRFVSLEQVAAAAGSVVYDARAADRFAGASHPLDPRPGHLPGALSAPWAGNLSAGGLFRPAAELRERFAAAVDRPAIAYCGSGVTACHDLLAMHVAGLERTALYTGSWSQWAADPARPADIG